MTFSPTARPLDSIGPGVLGGFGLACLPENTCEPRAKY